MQDSKSAATIQFPLLLGLAGGASENSKNSSLASPPISTKQETLLPSIFTQLTRIIALPH
jgi:hypothetical protein